ncbi:TetR/AcrR family transcriptional regulator [Leucobacter viscericola]|uniref:TetR/AcrR family transcriptional regulator n=2 Tax=Leucobacter viscericola TaxID=2714935 RepID=A0A6G7XJR8_9MICO|nr:TetR/AcrR family transcriptional regulator [Leucobacter viscericola]
MFPDPEASDARVSAGSADGSNQVPEAALSARRLETRNRLLDAAAEVFTESGLQGASVESVCSRAGFTRGAFYSNFSSKEELFLALLDREYDQRTQFLQERAAELIPLLASRECLLTPEDTAQYVTEFFAPTGWESTWFALETEFMLLAMREPTSSLSLASFIVRSRLDLEELVEGILHAAGRRFTIPVDRAMPILGGIYERAFRITALAGPDAPEGLNELGGRIAELLFAITEDEG